MKKLIYSLGIALIAGLAANAAVPQLQKMTTMPKDFTQGISFKKLDDSKAQASSRKESKRKADPVDEFLGYWKWEGHNWLNSVVFPNEGVMSIEKIEGTNNVRIFGFEQFSTVTGRGLTGSIDAEGRLIINRQEVITAADGDYFTSYGSCFFQPYTVSNVPDKPGYVSATKTDKPFWLVLATDAEGTIWLTSRLQQPDEVTDEEWPNYWMNGATIPASEEGYYWLCGGINSQALEFFEFFASEWQSVGTAMYEDAWLNPIMNEHVPAYEVELFQNKLDNNRYLIFDPYGPDSPFGVINDTDDEGYLVFDMTNPNCVLFEPYVFAYQLDMGNEEGGSSLQDFYNYNAEGYYVIIQGSDIEEVEANMLDRGTEPSYYDKGTVYIYNGLFDMLPDGVPGQGYSWTTGEMSGYIQFPSGFDPNGVETIVGEENATPVYYNLQGVRVNNPEKGQLLIVSKGNKTTKQIIR